MHIPVERYLSMIRKELATSLMPKDDDNARRIATYTLRILNQVQARMDTLPTLRSKAIGELDGLLDELNTLLRSINGAMVLTGDLTRYIRIAPDYERLEPVLQRMARVLVEHPSEASKKMLRRLTTILLDMEAALDKTTRANETLSETGSPTEVPPLDETQTQALQSYIRRKFDEPDLELGKIKAITGGGSKKTLIIKLLNTKRLPDTIVLRGDQAGGVVESTVVDEYQLVETLYAAGLPVPQPFAAEADTSITGAAFIIVGYIEGVNNGDHISIYEPSRSFGVDLAHAIGKLHAIPPEKFGDKIPGAKTTTQEEVKREMDTFERIWRCSDQPSVAFELSYAWLKQHMHFTDGQRSLNHCDLACHNFLARDGRLTAVLDWETTAISNPAHDLAYMYPLVIQMMPWEDFLTEYEKAGGKRPSQEAFDFFHLWTSIWRATFLLVARSFFHSGVSDSVVLAYGTQHLWQRANYELHKTVQEVTERP
jgi:aminoglycoside phosphotransferase (APT) family kinase protein